MHLHRKFSFLSLTTIFFIFRRWLFPTNCLAGENVNQSSIKCQSNQHPRPKSHWTPVLIGPYVFLFQFLSIRKCSTCRFRGLAYSFNIFTALACKTLSFLNASNRWELLIRRACAPTLTHWWQVVVAVTKCHRSPRAWYPTVCHWVECVKWQTSGGC